MTHHDCSREPGQHDLASSPKAHGEERTLRSERLQIERKTFLLALKENPRGQFLRITEDVGGRRDTIIIPASGLDEFLKDLQTMIDQIAPAPALTDSIKSADYPPP